MANTDALFAEADTNNDGTLNENEFRNFLSRNSVTGSTGYRNSISAGPYGSAFYETSNYGGDLAYGNTNYNGISSESAYRSSVSNMTTDSMGRSISGGISSGDAASAAYRASIANTGNVQQYETDAQGLFKDKNPQVIRKPAAEGPLTYQQNIQVRFLQPPAVPPPGPLIIKEVRPPQPPAPEPLVVRQRAPPQPQPPSLILRERPPPAPPVVASQTVVRNLPAIPVPPRSLVIERLPAPPPKPRDIVIERWLPYPPPEKRKTIVQHAEPAKEYPKPRNVIIQYETPQVRVVRQFQRLGITQENPEAYIKRYGDLLFDTHTLVQQARAAGVVEDISPPLRAGSISMASSSELSPTTPNAAFDFASTDEFTSEATAVDIMSSGNRSFNSGGITSYESASYNGGRIGNIDVAFAAADTNKDGVLSAAEFRNARFP